MAQHRIIPNVQTYLQVHISKSANADALCEKKNIPELWLLAQKAETARAGAPLNPPDDSSWNAANDDGEDDDVDVEDDDDDDDDDNGD